MPPGAGLVSFCLPPRRSAEATWRFAWWRSRPGPPLSAYYVPFAIAPGEAVRLIGRGVGSANPVDAATAPAHVLPTIADVQVTFNGIPAELVSVQASEMRSCASSRSCWMGQRRRTYR
jgi:hypothetical protein